MIFFNLYEWMCHGYGTMPVENIVHYIIDDVIMPKNRFISWTAVTSVIFELEHRPKLCTPRAHFWDITAHHPTPTVYTHLSTLGYLALAIFIVHPVLQPPFIVTPIRMVCGGVIHTDQIAWDQTDINPTYVSARSASRSMHNSRDSEWAAVMATIHSHVTSFMTSQMQGRVTMPGD